jgi:hypothetical protein
VSKQRLNRAVNQFTTAVKNLMENQTEEKVIAHFAKSPSKELIQILDVCEQLEEYEICHVVSSAIKYKEQSVVEQTVINKAPVAA